jgi:hypothetical protein
MLPIPSSIAGNADMIDQMDVELFGGAEGDASNVADVGGGCDMEIDSSAEPAVTVWLAKTNAQSLQVACRDAAQDEEFRTWLRSYLLDPEGTYSDEALWQMHNAKGLRCNQPPYPKSPTASSGSVVVPPPRKKQKLMIVSCTSWRFAS